MSGVLQRRDGDDPLVEGLEVVANYTKRMPNGSVRREGDGRKVSNELDVYTDEFKCPQKVCLI